MGRGQSAFVLGLGLGLAYLFNVVEYLCLSHVCCLFDNVCVLLAMSLHVLRYVQTTKSRKLRQKSQQVGINHRTTELQHIRLLTQFRSIPSQHMCRTT